MGETYQKQGLGYNQILIGVNAGPVGQPGNFTSIETTKAVTEWQQQQSGGTGGRGMMLWSFSQDIQQFTASMPATSQYTTPYPSPNDHEWLKTIAQTMRGDDQWVVKQNCLTAAFCSVPPTSSWFCRRHVRRSIRPRRNHRSTSRVSAILPL